jgi:hypothetical protein
LKAEVEEIPNLIVACYRVAAENVVFQNTGESPVRATISRVSPSALSEVGGNIVELPPADCHLVAVCGIDRDGALVRSVADDVVAICIDVYLVADKRAVLRNHPRRSFSWENSSRRVVIFFL